MYEQIVKKYILPQLALEVKDYYYLHAFTDNVCQKYTQDVTSSSIHLQLKSRI